MRKRYIFLLCLFVVACKSKNNDLTGDRIPIFKEVDTLKITNSTIKLDSKLQTYTDYYGDGSVLNLNIENFELQLDKKDKIDFQDEYFSNIVFIDNTLYYVNKNGKLNGDYKIADGIKFAKLSYYKNTFYLTTGINLIIAFEKDGTIKWKKDLNVIPISAPVIENDTLYFITNDNKTFALDTESGQIKWIHYGNNSTTKLLGAANPIIYNNTIISAYSSGEVFFIEKSSGQMLNALKIINKGYFNSLFDLTDADSTPIIKNDVLFASANSGNTLAFSLKQKKILWEKEISTIINILTNSNYLFVLDRQNNLFALNSNNGDILWKTELKSDLKYKSLILANNNIYAFNEDGYQVIDPTNGRIIKNIEDEIDLYAKPITINGKLYGIGD